MTFFEVKVKYNQTQIDGGCKRVGETYALDALSFTEAESRILEYLHGEDELELTHEKIAPYGEVVLNMGADGRYYLVKYNIITLDEKSGKEKRHPVQVLFQEATLDKAKEAAHRHMGQSMCDYELFSIKETDIVDVLMKE